VEAYLSGQMSELPSVVQDNNELQCKIKTRILSLVDSMYVGLHLLSLIYYLLTAFQGSSLALAQLYINSLTDKFTEWKINTALNNMKKGEEALDKAYDDTGNGIKNQGHGFHELAKMVLFWVVYAKRPLITEELRHASAVEPDTCGLDKMNLSSCAGLITVDWCTIPPKSIFNAAD
jgi:hypothetical protein